MSTNQLNYIHLNWDRNFPLKIYKKPNRASLLKVGDRFPSLTLDKNALILQHIPYNFDNQPPVHLRKLMNRKPLVISFLSGGWNGYGLKHLQKLVEAYHEILHFGGNLLVVVQATQKEVKEMVQHFDIPFNLLADPHNQLAAQLGLYQPEFPIWERIAGISDDVILPATYVISASEKVVYASVDHNFDKPFKATEMLASVFGASKNIPVVIMQELAA